MFYIWFWSLVPHCPSEKSASKNTRLCSEGSSLMPLIEDPKRGDWKQHAFFVTTRDTKVLIYVIYF